MIEQYKPIKASDLDNSLISIERTVTRTNTSTEPSGDQYSYKAKLIETRTPTSSGEGSPVLYTTSNIQDSGGVFSNSTESGPTKDLVTVSDFKSSVATKASSSHSHSLSDVKEFTGWSITQNSSKDIVFDVYSPTTWTAVTDSKFSTSPINGICYGNGKFVAVGASGKIAYSYDGITWTAVVDSKFGSSAIGGICYGNGKFVAVGYNRKIAYSYDGITWTAVVDSTFVSNSDIHDVCYGNGKFIAVGGYMKSINLNDYLPNGAMAYSTDGVTWIPIDSSPLGSYYIRSICYGNGKYVAVGGRPSTTINGNTVGASGTTVYSTDGITWTAVTNSHFETSQIHSICYGNGKFVAGGESGKMACSEVGTGWTAVSNSKFGTSTIRGVCYGNGKYVAVGTSGKIAYSSDGIKWTLVSDSKFDTTYVHGICYGNGRFVAGGDSGKMAYSKVFR